MSLKRSGRKALVPALILALAGCSSFGASGPSARSFKKVQDTAIAGDKIRVVELDGRTAGYLSRSSVDSFASVLGDVPQQDFRVGPGDSLSISIFEAPPALLFGPSAAVAAGAAARGGSIAPPSTTTSLPPVVIDQSGQITLPFVGTVQAAGQTLSQLQTTIRARLKGKANDPQVLVSQASNVSRTVTLLGETGANIRAPLSPHGERILDILASGDTLKQSVDKTTIQIARGDRVVAMPLSAVIANPAQNIRLQPGDVVTALFQPYSFTALGSVKQASEVQFEASGITLAQALARVGGLDAQKADVRGVFVFRFEAPAALGLDNAAVAQDLRDKRGRIPVIYKLDMSRPESLFLAQQFAVHDRDVIYVSQAPLLDLQNFSGIVSQFVFTFINIGDNLR
ncbi:polysaccharide biosynthesis/export family protein [Novosphingobium sp. P6W]|uniref:polysaccharide biosynthesis/export family protein n=1 Tax=Novosphingobium sp. P6W TaxID=1609758 RepID=UPI0005C2FB52|nr:polysaccharide biosynthesis/export family protein [Novosphingobium sp. P6W]AXB80667.1 polysaccharide export protein [Novosphingobium sp. P6W]KIS29494.1 hypothetical protein TQ38_27495 [Novosphingobium sp. P6W]